MYNLFKKILPALRSRFFGNNVTLSLPPKVVYCSTLYIYDTYEQINIIDDYSVILNINDYNDTLYISDCNLELNIKDQQSWEINDGCG